MNSTCFTRLVFEPRTDEQNHALIKFITAHDFYRCDQCNEQQIAGSTMFSCRETNYDLCEKCFGPIGVIVSFFNNEELNSHHNSFFFPKLSHFLNWFCVYCRFLIGIWVRAIKTLF